MKALVTGAGGFLGQYIVEQLLARGDCVRGFSRKRYAALEALGIETFQGDVRDADRVADACAGMDVVFHTAAVTGIWGPWKYFHGINTLGTENVVAGCLHHSVSRLVYTSSPSVTFNGDDQPGVDESAPYARKWLCHYPQTKALAEQHVLAAHRADGLLTCALRPHLIWGPRDRHLIPRLLERAKRGQLRRVGDGNNLVDMVYVENAARAHLQAADALTPESPVGGQAYFISQGEPVNCWDWIGEIIELAGLPAIRRSITGRTAWCLGASLEAAYRVFRSSGEPRMTRFLAAQLSTSHYFDITRAREHFGYCPEVSTEQGMHRLAAELTYFNSS